MAGMRIAASPVLLLRRSAVLTRDVYKRQASCSSASCSSACSTLPPINTTLAQTALSEGRPVLDRDHGHIRLLEPFSRKERLLILGGGHVGLALAEFAAKTGFSVYVADDRPSFANQLRFPWAEEVYCMDFPRCV